MASACTTLSRAHCKACCFVQQWYTHCMLSQYWMCTASSTFVTCLTLICSPKSETAVHACCAHNTIKHTPARHLLMRLQLHSLTRYISICCASLDAPSPEIEKDCCRQTGALILASHVPGALTQLAAGSEVRGSWPSMSLSLNPNWLQAVRCMATDLSCPGHSETTDCRQSGARVLAFHVSDANAG